MSHDYINNGANCTDEKSIEAALTAITDGQIDPPDFDMNITRYVFILRAQARLREPYSAITFLLKKIYFGATKTFDRKKLILNEKSGIFRTPKWTRFRKLQAAYRFCGEKLCADFWHRIVSLSYRRPRLGFMPSHSEHNLLPILEVSVLPLFYVLPRICRGAEFVPSTLISKSYNL